MRVEYIRALNGIGGANPTGYIGMMAPDNHPLGIRGNTQESATRQNTK